MKFEDVVKDANYFWELQDQYRGRLIEQHTLYMPYAVRIYFRDKDTGDVCVIGQNRGIEAFNLYTHIKRLIDKGFVTNVHHIEITNIDRTIVRKFYVEKPTYCEYRDCEVEETE